MGERRVRCDAGAGRIGSKSSSGSTGAGVNDGIAERLLPRDVDPCDAKCKSRSSMSTNDAAEVSEK